MVTKVKSIWMDGKMVNWDDANVHILTHTLHYGLGVFEGIRSYELASGGSAIFRLKEHVDRLYDSAHLFMLKIPFSREEICQAHLALMQENQLKAGYLRPLVYVGAGEMGLHSATHNPVRVAIITWPWGTYLGEDGVKNGIRAKISSFTRLVGNVNLPKGKTCGNYINSILAKNEAVLAGYSEALLLDSEGYLAEASGENIFIVKNGRVHTPPLSSNILRGITRDSVITLLKESGVEVIEEKICREDAYLADEIFLTGTAAEVCPIRELDDRQIGSGKPGPVTQKIQQLYFDAVRGKSGKHADWLAKY